MNDDTHNTQTQELAALRTRFNQLLLTEKDGTYAIDLSQIWGATDDLYTLYAQLTDLKACLDSLRPLSPAQVANLNGNFDVEYTYESNRIEGNTLTMQETHLVINKGLTVKGKSLNEHLEAINHQEAIDYIRSMADERTPFNERCLLDIHTLVLHGIGRQHKQYAGRYRQENVTISGSDFVPPSFLHVPERMAAYFAFYEQHQSTIHPVELAAEMHERLVTIHPFVDGNGRTARLVMNLMLLKHGYPVTILSGENARRYQYYDSLEATQTGKDPDKIQFKTLVAQAVKHWLFEYLHLVAPNGSSEQADKGYYFFKRIEALLQ